MILLKLIIAYFKGFSIITFDPKHPPSEGDTITVGNLVATFRDNPQGGTK